MFGIGTAELLMMLVIGSLTIGVPIAILISVILIYKNTRK